VWSNKNGLRGKVIILFVNFTLLLILLEQSSDLLISSTFKVTKFCIFEKQKMMIKNCASRKK